jgi:hypothetical protein
VEDALDQATTYVAAEKFGATFSVLILNSWYFNVTGVSPQLFHSRSFSCNNASTLTKKWGMATKNFLSTIEEACGGHHDKYIEDVWAVMLEIGDIVEDLEPLSRLGNCQEKCGPEEVVLLKKHGISFGKRVLALRRLYPEFKTVWLKLHVSEKHSWQFAEVHGMLGRVKAQGVESTHVRLHAQDRLARCIPGAADKALYCLRQTGTYNSSDVAEIRRDFKKMRVKQKEGRKKVVRPRRVITAQEAATTVISEANDVSFGDDIFARWGESKCPYCKMIVPTRSLLVHKLQLHVTGEVLNSILFDGMPTATGDMWGDEEEESENE